LSKFVTHTGLYCSKQLETTFNQVGKKSLHITFKGVLHTYMVTQKNRATACTDSELEMCQIFHKAVLRQL